MANTPNGAKRCAAKPKARFSRREAESALAAHERVQAISDEIRARHSVETLYAEWGANGRYWPNWLEPLGENAIIRDYRATLAASPAKPSKARKRPAKVETPKPAAAPVSVPERRYSDDLSPLEAFRMSGRELQALADNPIAVAEIRRRKEKRAAKRAGRKVAA